MAQVDYLPPLDAVLLSAAQVREHLQPVHGTALRELSERAGIHINVIRNIKTGETANPGIDTVRAFWPYLVAMEKAAQVLRDELKHVAPQADPGS